MADKKEQQMLEEIQSFHQKKDYYDVLGISKTATESDIKKAYRTLALRFHPDKNQYEGAKEVFKKVSNAYSVLIDQDKRAHYDRFGPEEDRPQRQHHRGQPQQDFQFEEFDDIFRAFFGQMPMHQHRRGNVHTYSYSFGGQPQQGQRRNGFNFYFFFIIIFILYSLAPLFQSKPNYSVTPSNDYRFKITTSVLNVEYFANQHYFEQIKDLSFKKQVEMMIDREHLGILQRKCEAAKKEKKRFEEFAYREQPGTRRESYLNQARGVSLLPCHTINDYRLNHEEYIRDLTYMR